MATQEYLELVYAVKGMQAIKDLQTEQTKLEGQARTLESLYNAGSISEANFARQAQKLADSQANVTSQLTRLQQIQKGVTSQTQSHGRAILQASYALQDFSSANGGLMQQLASIQNNIPGILAGFGVGAGLTGVISAASIGVVALYQNWRTLTSAFRADLINNTAAATDRLTKRVEELKKEAKLTASEVRELNRAEEELAGIQAMHAAAKVPGFGQANVKKAFQEAITQKGGGYGQLNTAAGIAAQAEFQGPQGLSENEQAEYQLGLIMQASKEGTFTGPTGKPIKVDQKFMNDFRNSAAFRKRVQRDFNSQVVPFRQRQMLQQIGEGNTGALAQMEGLLRSRGFTANEEGRVFDARGREQPALSTLLAASPERAEALQARAVREQNKTDRNRRDAADYKQAVKEITGVVGEPVKEAIAGGKSKAEVRSVIADALKRAFPKRDFTNLGQKFLDDILKEAVGSELRGGLRAEAAPLRAAGDLTPKQLRERLRRQHAEKAMAAGKEEIEIAGKKTGAQLDAQRETEAKIKKEQEEGLLGDEGFAAQAMLMIQQLHGTRFASKRQAAFATNRVGMSLRAATERNLLNRGIPAEQASRLAQGAPKFFEQQLNAKVQAAAQAGLRPVQSNQRVQAMLIDVVRRSEARDEAMIRDLQGLKRQQMANAPLAQMRGR